MTSIILALGLDLASRYCLIQKNLRNLATRTTFQDPAIEGSRGYKRFDALAPMCRIVATNERTFPTRPVTASTESLQVAP